MMKKLPSVIGAVIALAVIGWKLSDYFYDGVSIGDIEQEPELALDRVSRGLYNSQLALAYEKAQLAAERNNQLDAARVWETMQQHHSATADFEFGTEKKGGEGYSFTAEEMANAFGALPDDAKIALSKDEKAINCDLLDKLESAILLDFDRLPKKNTDRERLRERLVAIVRERTSDCSE